jgi:hypothetical protein
MSQGFVLPTHVGELDRGDQIEIENGLEWMISKSQ